MPTTAAGHACFGCPADKLKIDPGGFTLGEVSLLPALVVTRKASISTNFETHSTSISKIFGALRL